MSHQVIEKHRENAEIYTDPVVCKQKSLELLKEINIPSCILPLEEIVEVGYNAQTGFVWLKQKKPKEHKYKKIGKLVWYDTQVTAFVEDRRMKKITGVKSREILIWVTVSDISISDPEGPVVCKQKIAELLKEIHLPSGLLPLEDLVEVGRNLQTGFVWIKQKKTIEHKFKKVKKLVSYDTELTMFVEDRRMKKLTGLKSKEVFTFFTISDVSITDPEGKKINFTTSTGICVSFPASAFDKEEEEQGRGNK